MGAPHSDAVSKISQPIKIDTVEPILIKPSTRGYAFLIVRIRTDQGIDGIGECHASGEARSLAIRDFVDSMSGELVGTNPLEIEAFLNGAAQGGSGWEWFAAISAIEIAMWDILGTGGRASHLHAAWWARPGTNPALRQSRSFRGFQDCRRTGRAGSKHERDGL